jgi:hypothetical protein
MNPEYIRSGGTFGDYALHFAGHMSVLLFKIEREFPKMLSFVALIDDRNFLWQHHRTINKQVI